jgi:hypothetical protein
LKHFLRCAALLYRCLLMLYPAGFRLEFGCEMQAVFGQALLEQASAGFSQVLAFCLRELLDFPGSLIQQVCLAARQEDSDMTTLGSGRTDEMDPAHLRGSWGAAFMAGLPHFIMGSFGLGNLLGLSNLIQTAVYLCYGLFAALTLAVLVISWRRGWPVWSASWYLYGVWMLIVAASLVIKALPLYESWRYANFLIFLLVGICLLGYVFLCSRSRLHGLLAVFFFFPFMGIAELEFVPDPIEGVATIGLGMLFALVAGGIVRRPGIRLGLGVVLSTNILAGIALAYISEYQATALPPELSSFASPTFTGFLGYLVPYVLITSGIIALPFLLRGLKKVRKPRLAA